MKNDKEDGKFFTFSIFIRFSFFTFFGCKVTENERYGKIFRVIFSFSGFFAV